MKTKMKLANAKNIGQNSLFLTTIGTSLIYFLAFLLLVQNFSMERSRLFQLAEMAMKGFHFARVQHSIVPWAFRKLSYTGFVKILGSY